MSYINNNDSGDSTMLKNFKIVQNDLSKTTRSLLDIKTRYTNIVFKSIDENIVNNDCGAVALKKIEELKVDISELEKKMNENHLFLKSAIDLITKHLAVVEKKQRGFLDKIKIWKTKKDIDTEMRKMEKTSLFPKQQTFNFND